MRCVAETSYLGKSYGQCRRQASVGSTGHPLCRTHERSEAIKAEKLERAAKIEAAANFLRATYEMSEAVEVLEKEVKRLRGERPRPLTSRVD